MNIQDGIKRAEMVSKSSLEGGVIGITLGPRTLIDSALRTATLEKRRPGSLPLMASFRASLDDGILN